MFHKRILLLLTVLHYIIISIFIRRYNRVLPPDNQLDCQTNPDDFAIRRQTEEVKIY